MILVFEQDSRRRRGRRLTLRPVLFRGRWNGQRTWRLCWGMWSVSAYPSPGLREFFETAGRGCWHAVDTRNRGE